jgi:hypothetical protein
VTDEPGWPVPEGVARERGHRLLAARRADEVDVVDAGEPSDRRRERPTRIGEGLERVTEPDFAAGSEPYADRADLDDPLALSVVTGGLDVDGDELAFQRGPI